MSTSGANSVSIPVAGQPGTWTWSGGASGVAGIDGFSINVDPNTFVTTEFSTANTTLSAWTGFPSGYVSPGYTGALPTFPISAPSAPSVNKYDPATKTFHLAWRWNPSANIREYEVILKYKKPRP
jgi:hypothetical protein